MTPANPDTVSYGPEKAIDNFSATSSSSLNLALGQMSAVGLNSNNNFMIILALFKLLIIRMFTTIFSN